MAVSPAASGRVAVVGVGGARPGSKYGDRSYLLPVESDGADIKAPRRFVPLTDLGAEAFPRTGLGKIVLPDVQKLALERLTPSG